MLTADAHTGPDAVPGRFPLVRSAPIGDVRLVTRFLSSSIGPTASLPAEPSRTPGQRRRARRTTSLTCGVSGGGSMRGSTA